MDPIRFFLSALAAIAVGIPFAIATRAVRPAGENLAEEAIRHGRVVSATLVKSAFLPPDMSSQHSQQRQVRWLCQYRYTVGGKDYTYRCTLTQKGPAQMELCYPAGKPDKAMLPGSMKRKRGGAYVMRALVPIVVWAAVYWALPVVGVGSW